MKDTLLNNFKYFQDHILFLLFVLAGIFLQKFVTLEGKPTLIFLVEGIVSFLWRFQSMWFATVPKRKQNVYCMLFRIRYPP
jgi:hypothetical protein